MARKIEKLLYLAADFQRFQEDDTHSASRRTGSNLDELSMDQLDLIAAAVQEPVWKEQFDKETK